LSIASKYFINQIYLFFMIGESLTNLLEKGVETVTGAVENVVDGAKPKTGQDGKPEKLQVQSVPEVWEAAMAGIASMLGVSGGTEGKGTSLPGANNPTPFGSGVSNSRAGMGDDSPSAEQRHHLDQMMKANQPKSTN
jgi:hypothetical protein